MFFSLPISAAAVTVDVRDQNQDLLLTIPEVRPNYITIRNVLTQLYFHYPCHVFDLISPNNDDPHNSIGDVFGMGDAQVQVQILDLEEEADEFWEDRGDWFRKGVFNPRDVYRSFTGQLYNKHQNGQPRSMSYYFKGVRLFDRQFNEEGDPIEAPLPPFEDRVDVRLRRLSGDHAVIALAMPRNRLTIAEILIKHYENNPDDLVEVAGDFRPLDRLNENVEEGGVVYIPIVSLNCNEEEVSHNWFEKGVRDDKGRFTGKKLKKVYGNHVVLVEYWYRGQFLTNVNFPYPNVPILPLPLFP